MTRGLDQATRAARQSHLLYRQLRPFRGKDGDFGSPVTYPQPNESFPRRLAGLAAMLAAGLPLRCVALTAPGAYDTHDSQPGDLEEGLQLTAASLFAFQRDLEARGLADRVITLVWSEFGRRPEENGSNGTDHGAAGMAFVIGTRASGRMVGELPDLSRLDRDGNLRPNSDFRALYKSLIEGWLGGEAGAVIPARAEVRRDSGTSVSARAAALGRCRRRSWRWRPTQPRLRASPRESRWPQTSSSSSSRGRWCPPVPRSSGSSTSARTTTTSRSGAEQRARGRGRCGRSGPASSASARCASSAGATQLWCTLADHRALGMRATLKVRRPAPAPLP